MIRGKKKKVFMVLFTMVLCLTACFAIALKTGFYKSEAGEINDVKVKEAQKWLNDTYMNVTGYTKIGVDGKVGQEVETALIKALQKEINVTVDGGFGPGTRKACPEVYSGTSNENLVKIVQYGLYCKGYDPKEANGTFGENTTAAVNELLADIGINTNGKVNGYVMQALLNTDSFKKNASGEDGIRKVQQFLNNKYATKTENKIISTEGLLGKDTNMAFIKAYQYENNIKVDGLFGDQSISTYDELAEGNTDTDLVMLLQCSVILRGYDCGDIDGIYDTELSNKIKEYQEFMCITVNGKADKTTGLSLLVSYGDKSRSTTMIDCITILDAEKITALKSAGYNTVGRYLTNTPNSKLNKAMTATEVSLLVKNGMKIVPIYQTSANSSSYYSDAQGKKDAIAALNAARTFGFQSGTTIYFVVDYDATYTDVTNKILPYFKAISQQVSSCIEGYKVGIYASRQICTRVGNAGYAQYSYVSDMSSSYYGNAGQRMPKNWAFDQYFETTFTGNTQFGIDKVSVSGKDSGANKIAKLTYGVKSIEKGKNITLSFAAIPASSETVTWKSSNTSIATVSAGKVTGKAIGTTYITATTPSGLKAICKLSVTAIDIKNGTVASVSKQAFSGSAIKPVPALKYGKTTLKKNTDYTISYKNNTNPGTGTIVFTGKGQYKGTISKTFTIYVKTVTGLKMSSNATTSVKLTWTKQSGVTGYSVEKYDTSKKKYVVAKTVTSNTNSTTITSLKAGTSYKIRVRSYKTVGKTPKYGAYSSVVTVITKPATPGSFKVATSGTKKIKISWSKSTGSNGYVIQRATSKNGTYSTIKTITSGSTTSYINSGLTKGRTYYYRIRAYKTLNGVKYYSSYSSVKSVKSK